MSMTSFHRRTVATVAPIATVGSASPWVCGVCRTFLHTHDEIVAEMPVGQGGVEEFKRLLIEAPHWADGLPIAAKVFECARFKKD